MSATRRVGRSGARLRAAAAAAILLLPACASSGGTPALVPATAPRPFVAGYHPYWAGDAWQAYPFDLLDELYFFETEADSEGRLSEPHGWPQRWQALIERASAGGVQVVPTVSMHDPEAFAAVFTDPVRSERMVDEALELLRDTPAASGLHLDVEVFEPVSLDARDGFTAFVALLRDRMREEAPEVSLSVFLLAFDDDDVYNERALGRIADFVVVQGYDYHSAESPNAGPLGATTGWGRLNWETVLTRLDSFGVPRNKIVMGVPLYGYEWPVTTDEPGAATRGPGRTVPLTAPDDVLPGEPRAIGRAAQHGARRDRESGVPWYAFQDADGWWQGWYEDAESLAAKYDFVRSRGLGGIAIFPLAYGNDDVWAEVRRAMR